MGPESLLMRKMQISGAKGLVTSERRADMGSKGYAIRTNNALIRRTGIYEPRFGTELLGSGASGVLRVDYDLTNKQIIRKGTNLFQKWTGSAWTDLDTTRTYTGSESQRNFLFALSNEGLRRINPGNTATEIGYVPEGLDMSYTLTGSSGIMANNVARAYRVVWGIKNSLDEFFLGAPGGRIIVVNEAGGSRDVQLSITVPSGITQNHFFQIYRTNESAAANIDPGDDMYLIYEAFPTAGEITAKLVTITDVVPTGNGGAALYTNQGQQGDQEGNFPCEAASSSLGQGDLAIFSDCLWATRLQPRSSLEITLLSVLTDTGINARTFTANTTSGSTTLASPSSTTGLAIGMAVEGSGIPAGSTITQVSPSVTISQQATATASGVTITAGDRLVIAGETYTAWTSEDVANRKFLVSTDTSPSKAIRLTTDSLVKVINRGSANGYIYARSISAADQFPGRILLTAVTDRASTYTAQAFGHPTAYYPNLQTTITILSKEEKGAVLYSKPFEPQAWPPGNVFIIPNNATVSGIAALRSALVVFTDRGIYRITGIYGNFSVDLIDASSILLSDATHPGSGVVVVDNVAYALCTKGLVAVTESTVQLVRTTPEHLTNSSTPVGRLSGHLGDGLVFVPTSYGTFVYHAKQDAWTSFDTAYTYGAYNFSEGKMYLHSGNNTYASRDAQYLATGLYDSTAAGTIDSVGTDTIVVASVPSGLEVGDLVTSGAATVTITSISGTTLGVSSVTGIGTGSCTFTIGYTMEITYAPVADGLGVKKLLVDADLVFDGADILPTSLSAYNNTGYSKYVTTTYATDLSGTVDTNSAIIASPDQPHFFRHYIPGGKKRCSVVTVGFKVRICKNKHRVVGMDINFEPESERTTRNG